MAGRRTTGRPEPRLQQAYNNPTPTRPLMPSGQSLIGEGARKVMDQIYRALVGDAAANLKQGNPFSQKDVLNSAATIGLNSLPIPIAAGAVKAAPAVAAGVKAGARTVDNAAAKAIINRTISNPQMSIALPPQAMEKIARGGKVKNMFEVAADGGSRAPGYLAERSGIESRLLGIGPEVAAAQRPTYGVMSSGIDLPYAVANRAPGATGEVLRLFDPRFNNILRRYSSPSMDNSSALTGNGFLRTNPGVKGNYTISDSFQTTDRAFTIGNKADTTEATQKILDLARKNADYKRSRQYSSPFSKIPGLRQPAGRKEGINAIGDIANQQASFPYIELQAAAKTNPASLMRRLETPMDSLDGSAKRQADNLSNLLKESGASGVSAKATRVVDPNSIGDIQDLLLKVRNTPAGRGASNLNYNRKQTINTLMRRLKELNAAPLPKFIDGDL